MEFSRKLYKVSRQKTWTNICQETRSLTDYWLLAVGKKIKMQMLWKLFVYCIPCIRIRAGNGDLQRFHNHSSSWRRPLVGHSPGWNIKFLTSSFTFKNIFRHYTISTHNDRSSPNIWHFHMEASWKYILSKRPIQYCLFYDYKRCVTSNLSIISPKIVILSVKNIQKYKNDWKIGCYTPLIIIKQAILVWSFRQLRKQSRKNCRPFCLVTMPAHACGSSEHH